MGEWTRDSFVLGYLLLVLCVGVLVCLDGSVVIRWTGGDAG